MATDGRRSFRHEALFYADEDEFLAGTVPFAGDAVEAEEPVLVALTAPRARALGAELGDRADSVLFAEMEKLGRNPACIIPAWRRFVDGYALGGRPVRGIGESIWPGRSPTEMVECHQHESLLNLAFADTHDFWLLCPYDAGRLEPDVLEAARCNHPFITAEEGTSGAYLSPEAAPSPFEAHLDPPAGAVEELRFGREDLRRVRAFVAERASRAGLPAARAADLVLAANELAANSVMHGGGRGKLRLWRENGAVLCEVIDRGRFAEPLLGRKSPSHDSSTGRGLWLVNHLCDLVQMRTFPAGNVVRVHMRVA